MTVLSTLIMKPVNGRQADAVAQIKQYAQQEIQRLEEESRLNHDMLPMDMIG